MNPNYPIITKQISIAVSPAEVEQQTALSARERWTYMIGQARTTLAQSVLEGTHYQHIVPTSFETSQLNIQEQHRWTISFLDPDGDWFQHRIHDIKVAYEDAAMVAERWGYKEIADSIRRLSPHMPRP